MERILATGVLKMTKLGPNFRVPVHRIQYVIRSRGIAHVGMAGNVRLYDEAAAQWIGSELRRIADDRNGRPSQW